MPGKASGRHYAKLNGVRVRHPNRVKRQRFPVTACRFREARLACGLGVSKCADLLRVSERTIRNWEAGAARIPFAAYKLLRVLRGGRYLSDPIWRDFRVVREVLITPEGHRFHAGDLAWWSLLVRRARAFEDLSAARRSDAGAGLPARLGEPAEQSAALGLVSSSTSDTRPGPETGPSPENKGFAGHLVGAEKRPAPGSLPALRADRGPAGGSGRQRQVPKRLAVALRAAGGEA